MKTNICLFALLLLTFACGKKNEDPQPVPVNNACQAARLDDATGYSLLEYNAAGNVIKTTVYNKSKVIQSTLFADYADGKLSKTRYFKGASVSGTPTSTATATTDGSGNIATLTVPFLGTPVTATFSYTSGRVSGIEISSSGSGASYRYEYDSRGNIAKVFEKSNPGATELLTNEYTYDDKTNPARNNVGLLAFVAIFGSIADIYSPNNALTAKQYKSNGQVLSTDTFTYTYNDKGFPLTVKQVTQEPGKAAETSNVTIQYNCK